MCFLVLCNGGRGLSIRKLEAIWRFPRNQLASFHRNNMDVQSSFCHDDCTSSGQSLVNHSSLIAVLGPG